MRLFDAYVFKLVPDLFRICVDPKRCRIVRKLAMFDNERQVHPKEWVKLLRVFYQYESLLLTLLNLRENIESYFKWGLVFCLVW